MPTFSPPTYAATYVPTPRKKACDFCRRRKVKCDGKTNGCDKSKCPRKLKKDSSRENRRERAMVAVLTLLGPSKKGQGNLDAVTTLEDAISKLPSPTYKDPFNPLTYFLDRTDVSFAMESRFLYWKMKVRKADIEDNLKKSDQPCLWMEQFMIQQFFRKNSCPYEVVHRRTMVKNFESQPSFLSLAGQLSVPQAPHALVRSYFLRAKALTFEFMEEFNLENAQACYCLCLVAFALGDARTALTMLEISIRMAEYLKLHIEPNDVEDLRRSLSWEEKEMVMVMLARPTMIQLSRIKSATVQPLADNKIFFCLEEGANLSSEPLPAPDNELMLMYDLSTIAERIEDTFQSRPITCLQDLERVSSEVNSLESDLEAWHFLLPPHLSTVPTEIAVHQSFSPDEVSFEQMLLSSKVNHFSPSIPINYRRTKFARTEVGDQLFIHALYHTLICLLHRPKLQIYAKLGEMPAPESEEEASLLRSIRLTEKSASIVVTIADRIIRAGVALSEEPSLLILKDRESVYERGFGYISETKDVLAKIQESKQQTLDKFLLLSPSLSTTLSENSNTGSLPLTESEETLSTTGTTSQNSFESTDVRLTLPESQIHPMLRFPLLICSLILADLAALQQIVETIQLARQAYLIHCHTGLSILQRLTRSVPFYWIGWEHDHQIVAAKKDMVARMAGNEGIRDLDACRKSGMVHSVLSGALLQELRVHTDSDSC
ncbi:hypothetical protein HDU97_005673 [Phlyctochytrium planicorne]|nr:hypothetical protein HDU97_005673 [Phlyctochytrium planicorne]